MTDVNADTRRRIAEFLPGAIASALKSYREFLCLGYAGIDDGVEHKQDHAKHFKAHHESCKSAIAHIELLIKLGKSVEAAADEVEEVERERLRQSVKEAQAEIENKV